MYSKGHIIASYILYPHTITTTTILNDKVFSVALLKCCPFTAEASFIGWCGLNTIFAFVLANQTIY